MRRRVVRTSPAFFDQLDPQLGQSRGPNGEPSATDSLVFELPVVVEAFASRFDVLPEAVDRPIAGCVRQALPDFAHGHR